MDVPDTRPQTAEDWQMRAYDALHAFSPGAPIDEFSLLAGRAPQIDRIVQTVMQRGQHAILYGERGVGKSSLANTFSTKLLGGARQFKGIPINCHPTDDFSEIWRKVFRRIDIDGQNLAASYPAQITPDDVVVELSEIQVNTTPIIILDEFDKLSSKELRNLVANTIKNLSDRSVRATIVVVGVADSVSELIDEHESITRCLKQIPMQRMFPSELRQIVTKRLPDLGMQIMKEALNHIVALSRGLPHYTHLFGQQSAKLALENKQLVITLQHVEGAMPACIEETAQTIRENYHVATMSPRKGNIYKEVLLAAALAKVDDLGYFAPADLREPLSMVLGGRDTPVSLFGQHLKTLCEEDRGKILEQIGTERKFRYRFVEPMMQPFVLMNGRRNGLITVDQINTLAAAQNEPDFTNQF